MARYYRRRTYTRVVKPKKKWASNYSVLSGDITYGGSSSFFYFIDLAKNSTESSNPTPVVVKTGNFRVQFDLTLNVGTSGAVSARAYIIYVPQGWNFGSSNELLYTGFTQIVEQHPEWIMMWRQLDFGNANAQGSVDTSVVRMSSRMKRNLNSGDKVMFLLLGTGAFEGVQQRGVIQGACQYWTCAN